MILKRRKVIGVDRAHPQKAQSQLQAGRSRRAYPSTVCHRSFPAGGFRAADSALYVADGEADAVLVEVANFFHCPILLYDSDFFMFNVNDGYIPFDRFQWTARPITDEAFFGRAFMEQYGLN